MSDLQPDGASDLCDDDCAAAAERASLTGAGVVCERCGCTAWPGSGSVLLRVPFDLDPAPPVAPAGTVDLGAVLAELDLAGRWEAQERHHGTGPAPVRSPLASMQARGGSGDRPATRVQVAALGRLLTAEGRLGASARAGFVDALVEHCLETGGGAANDDDAQWVEGRRLALTLRGIPDPETRRGLRALGRRCTTHATWRDCALVIADELAPPALRAAWDGVAGEGRRGRPRVDPLAPPPDVEREAWGGDVLARLLEAWVAARSST